MIAANCSEAAEGVEGAGADGTEAEGLQRGTLAARGGLRAAHLSPSARRNAQADAFAGEVLRAAAVAALHTATG